MRDFRDAKAMAQTLRESLTVKMIAISHSESLELVSKMLGASDWNTLSALLQAERRDVTAPIDSTAERTARYPALPIRDFVPFPTMNFPLFVGREKARRALDDAFARHREIILVVQKDPAVEEPAFGDIYEIGVLARLLEIERLPEVDQSVLSGATKILIQAQRRVAIRRFIGEGGAFQAEFTDVSEGPILDAPQLIRRAVEHFERYAAAENISMPQTWPALNQIRDPGRVADVIAQHMTLPISDKQNLLSTIDPMERIEMVMSLMDSAV
jgi:ATP-dependent Lon protease